MNTSVAIFKRDLIRLLRNPIAAVVALGVCIVPCLYAWINIAANWDPYENTSDIPVAVVNQDQTVEIDDVGTLCIGNTMVEALHENDKIGWQFVSEDQALDGVRSGTYYAAIVIPADFTQSLTGVLNGDVQKAHLKYYVNEKVNAIAPKVTDTGASTIETQIDDQFVATVGKVVAQKLGGVADKLTGDVSDATQNIDRTLDEVRATLDSVDEKLEGLSASLRTAQDGLEGASAHLQGFEGVGENIANELGDTLDHLGQTRGKANQLVADINGALGNGGATIASLSSQANYDVSTIAGDLAQAQSQINAAIRTLENDLTDNQAMVSKLSAAQELVVKIEPTGQRGIELQADLSKDLSTELDTLVQIGDQEAAKLEELRSIAQKLQDASEQIANLSSRLNDRVQSATEALQLTQTDTVSTCLSQVHSALDMFVEVAQELQTAARLVDPIIAQTASVLGDLAETTDMTSQAIEATRGSLGTLTQTVDDLSAELGAIRSSSAWDLVKSVTKTNPEGVEEFLSAPVSINEKALYPVANYAAGVAPFFTSLALWVGGIALVAIFKLEVDEDEIGRMRPWQAYFGRWMLFVLLGIITAVVCCTGDLILGIQCVEVWAFYLAAIVSSFVFVNIIFALSVAFKHLGKAIAFTLIILQVPGSAGMYPIEMMPPFFQAIGPWLPFTYSNNAMREAIAGFYGWNLAYNLCMLLLFVIPAILIGLTARSHLVNVNALFDKRLRETDHLMVSEPVAIEGNRYRLASIVKSIYSPQEYREVVEERSAAFESAYPGLVRRGVRALILLPLALFVLMLIVDAPLPLIACLVVALIAIYAYLILVEYFHDRIAHKLMLTDYSPEELQAVMNDALRDELLPYAPIDVIIDRRRARQERRQERRDRRKLSGVPKILDRSTEGEDASAPDDASRGVDAR
ncbi:MAG: YhgE/Pip domain-containing protein [Coriobacteriales bacterium]|nr:YhgE/Pip domain-containing protein [Coriobacteriales bacterium]